MKGRLFLRTENPEDFKNEKVFHIHITYSESSDWKNALALRDYLKIHPDDLTKYALGSVCTQIRTFDIDYVPCFS